MNTVGDWICRPCGEQLGRVPRVSLISTYHIGHCDYCGAKDVAVTEPRDFLYPPLPERRAKLTGDLLDD